MMSWRAVVRNCATVLVLVALWPKLAGAQRLAMERAPAGQQHGAHAEPQDGAGTLRDEHGLAAMHGDGPGVPGHEADAEHADHGHIPSFSDINWYYGVLGEREGVEPSLLYRPMGMPVPLAALLLNSGIVFGLLYFAMRGPVASGLRKRKAGIMQGMDDASRMKDEAEGQLAEYEGKLASIDQAIATMRQEMREAAEAERRRVLAEAAERRARLEREARRLVEQERHAARETLQRDMVRAAVAAASKQLESGVTPGDQQQLVEEYLSNLSARTSVRLGGGA